MSENTQATESEETKKRGYGKVFSKFADMTSMSGVNYIKNTKLIVAKIAWSILLVIAFAALSVHLWFSLSQFYSYPKTAKINLGFANLKFPEITICNVNPVSKRRLDTYESETVAMLKKLVKALEPQTLSPELFNDSLSYDDIAELYSTDGSSDYYDSFWSDYDSTSFYGNYPDYSAYDYYYNYDFYDYYGGYSDDYNGVGDGSDGSGAGSDQNTGSEDNTGSGESPGSGLKKRRKRYAELLDGFNITEFDPTFDAWFREENSATASADEYRGKVDTSTKIDALFRKTFMSLARWERSRLGHNITKMLLKCTFSGRVCDENKKLFRLHQTAEYGNCWTLSSPKFLAQDAGPNGGLTVVLNLQSTDYLEGITQGYGARIQIHNRGSYPDPFQDGISIPASMETSIGLRMVTFERLAGYYGDCEDGEEFRKKYKRPYTRRTCQIFCHAELMIDRCGCFDETSEEVAAKTNQGKNMSSCTTVTQFNCVNRIRTALQDKTIVCNCKNPCKESTYVKSISNHQWPTDQHAKLLLAGICTVDTTACKSFLDANNTISRIYNNFLKLNIYFEDLNFEQIQEEPDIEIAQILSDVGGAVGLWIGLSVISFCEVVQLMVELINMTRHKMTRQRQERQNSRKRKHGSDKENNSMKPDWSNFENGSGFDGRNGFTPRNGRLPDVNSAFGPFTGLPMAYGGQRDRPSTRDYPLTGYRRDSKRSRY